MTQTPELDPKALMRQSMRDSFTPRAMVDSGAPVLAFAVIVPFATVAIASYVALGVGLVLAAERAIRRKPLQQVLSGLFGLGIAVLVANWSGKATGFYLPGILYNVALSLTLIVSLVVRRPIIAVVVGFVDEGSANWRERPVLRRAFTRVTLLAAVFYTAKTALQITLYATDHSSGLAGVRLALGLPPYLLILAYGFTQVRAAMAVDDSPQVTSE